MELQHHLDAATTAAGGGAAAGGAGGAGGGAEARTAHQVLAPSTAVDSASVRKSVAAAFVSYLSHDVYLLRTPPDKTTAAVTTSAHNEGPAAAHVMSSARSCSLEAGLPAKKVPLLRHLTAAKTSRSTTTTSTTTTAAAAAKSPPAQGTTGTIHLAASAAVLLACIAAAAAASASAATADPSPYQQPEDEIGKPAAATFSVEEEGRREEQGAAPYYEQEFVSPPGADGETATGAPAGVDEVYRRSGAASYEWYTPGSRQPTVPAVTDARRTESERLPALYSLSFLHDFLNYATAVLWFSAYAALLRRVYVARNINGLSLQSLFALVWVEVNNVLLIAVLCMYHRKPLTAEFFLVDVSSAAVSVFTFLYVYRFFRGGYERQRDNFGERLMRVLPLQHYSKKYYFAVLYAISFCLAVPMFLFRRASFIPPFSAASSLISSSSVYISPSISASSSAAALLSSVAARCLFYTLSFWECFNDTVLALALLPQLCMLYNKRPRKVTSLLATFVALLFFARLCAFFYWMTFPLFHRTYPAGRGIHLATEALNILLLSDFLYYYLKARFSGEADVALPL